MTRVLWAWTLVLSCSLALRVQADDATDRAAGFSIGVGAGAGSRAFVVPTREGARKLATSPFATVALDLTLRIAPSRRVGFDLRLAYHTSVAWQVELRPLFAMPEDIPARSQRFEATAAPIIRAGDSAHAVAVAFPLGFAVRSFWPRLRQFPVQDYLLAGFVMRAELRLPITEHARLRAAPELQCLPLTSRSLRASQLQPAGLAVGGEIALETSVSRTLRVALAYRQSSARFESRTRPLEDTERYLTASVAGEL